MSEEIILNGKKYRLVEDEKVVEEVKVDFSKFIGISDGVIAIKGEKGYLKSFPDFKKNGTSYNNIGTFLYDETPDYEEIDYTELKEGDVYFAGTLEDAKKNMELWQFRIRVGYDEDGDSIG